MNERFQLLHDSRETTWGDGTKSSECYIARVRQLGITAYGKTKDEAVAKAIKMTSGLLDLTFRDLEVEEL